METDTGTIDASPTAEESPQPVAESTSTEELAALFKEAVGDDSGAKETPSVVEPELDTPASASKAEAHQPEEDPKDREIAELRNRLDGLLPRYQALQKAHETRVAEERAGKRENDGKHDATLQEYGEIGEVILDLKKQLSVLQERSAILPEVHAEVLATQEERRKAAEAAEVRKTEERMTELGHSDFKEVSRSKEFKAWAETLPAEEREALKNTWIPWVYAKFLDDFKAARKSLPSRTTADIRNEREKRLASATTVDSKPSAPPESNERSAIWKRAFNS
jgi:hypothetical protein